MEYESEELGSFDPGDSGNEKHIDFEGLPI